MLVDTSTWTDEDAARYNNMAMAVLDLDIQIAVATRARTRMVGKMSELKEKYVLKG